MWEGEFTEELEDLFRQYEAENYGIPPDEYEELCYDAMTYDEFVSYIKEALRRHCDIVTAIDEIEGYSEEEED